MTYNDSTQRFEFDPNADQLGEGGFGRVYKTWDNTRREEVALKIAPVPPGMEELSLLQEFERVRHLMHGNIAIYLDCHRLDFPMMGRHDVAYMKYYQTGHLGQLLDQERLTPAQKEHVLLGILSGIEYLHSRQPFIIHRDLKPANILVVPRAGQFNPLITDSGISRSGAADAGKSFVSNTLKSFSLNFAAPEQADRDTLRRNADLWSFGVIVAYVWLDGRLPFRTEGLDLTTDTGQQRLRQRIRDLDLVAQVGSLPEPWQALVRRCLVLDPAQRLASCQEARQLLAPAGPGIAPASEPTQVLAPAPPPAPAPAPMVSPPALAPTLPQQDEPAATALPPRAAGQKKWVLLVGRGVGLLAVMGAAVWGLLRHRSAPVVPHGPLPPLVLKSFSPKSNALAVAAADGLRLTFSRTPTAADVAGIRVFSSQYRGLRSLKITIGDTMATLFPVGGNFRPGEVIAVSLPTGTPVQGGRIAQVYQFTVAASAGPAVFMSGTRVAVGRDSSSMRMGDVALGDVDGDGDLDMLTANDNTTGTVSVRLNDGKGHFTAPATNSEVAVGDKSWSVALGDVDGDGDLDVLASNFSSNKVNMLLNNRP